MSLILNSALESALKETAYVRELKLTRDEEWKIRFEISPYPGPQIMSYREHLTYKHLADYFTQHATLCKLNILDIGCGQMTTVQKLIQNTSYVDTYTAVDIKDMQSHATQIIPYVKTFEFLQKDIFKDSLSLSKKYDIVIIDIEPHGKEKEVYEIIKSFLNESSHLCILKHVGYLSIYGCCLADSFINTYEDVISDYYAEFPRNMNDIREIRDIFILFDSIKTENIHALLPAGEKPRYTDLTFKSFCVCC